MGTFFMFVRRRLSSSAPLTSRGQDVKLIGGYHFQRQSVGLCTRRSLMQCHSVSMRSYTPMRRLVHSLLMFALQLCMTFQCFVGATDWFGFQEMLYENDLPAALVVPSWLRLWSNDWIAGDTYCVIDTADVSPDEGLNYCGTLYAVLTGYLPVGQDQHLSALIQYVFALSGAPLLLAVRWVCRARRRGC